MEDNYSFRNKMESSVISYIEQIWDCQFAATNHEEGSLGMYSPIDGVIVKDGKLKAVVENRNRKETFDQVKNWGGILINYDKLVKGIEISKQLGVPFLFIVHFFNEGKLVLWEIVDKDGMISPLQITNKVAQKNLSEGVDVKKRRNVALLNNDSAKVITNKIINNYGKEAREG